MNGSKKLILRWGLDDREVKAGIQRLESKVKGFERFAATSLKRAGVGLVAIAGAATFAGTKFEQAIVRVGSNANASQAEIDRLSESARKMGAETIFSASQSADALYNLTSAGLNAEQSIATLAPTLALAAAEGAGLAESASYMTATLSQFGLGVQEADRVANALSATVSSSNQVIYDLGESLKYAGSQAKLSGVSMEETLGTLGVLANKGQKGSMAGTLLAAALREIAKQSGPLAPYMRDVNLEADGLAITLDKLKANGLTASEASRILGARSRGLAMLLDAGGESVRKMTERVSDTTDAHRKAAAMMDTTAGDLKTLASVSEAAGLSMFDAFRPQIREAIQYASERVRELTTWFELNKDELQNWAKTAWGKVESALDWLIAHGPEIKGVLAGVAAGFVTLKVTAPIAAMSSMIVKAGGLAKALKSLTAILAASPWGALATVVGLATAAFVAHRSRVEETDQAYQDARNSVKDFKAEVAEMTVADEIKAQAEGLRESVRVRGELVGLQEKELATAKEQLEATKAAVARMTSATEQHSEAYGLLTLQKLSLGDQVQLLEGILETERLGLEVDSAKLQALETRLGLLKKIGEETGTAAGAEGGEVDTAAATAGKLLLQQYQWQQKSLELQRVYWKHRIQTIEASGGYEGEEWAKAQIKLFEIEKEIGERRTAAQVESEYNRTQLTLEAQARRIEQEMASLEARGMAETEAYGKLKVQLLQVEDEAWRQRYERALERQEAEVAMTQGFYDTLIGGFQTYGQALISGEKSFSKIWIGIRQQFFGKALSAFTGWLSREVAAQLAADSQAVAAEVATQGALTTAKAGGVVARAGISKVETAQAAADQAVDIGKMTSGVVSFFGRLGPWGIPLAALTIAGFIALVSRIGRGRAFGGLVMGPGGDRDDQILTPTSRGEFVVQAPAVRRLGVPTLEEINRGRLPALAGAGGERPSLTVNLSVAPQLANVAESIEEFFQSEEGFWFFRELLYKYEDERSR